MKKNQPMARMLRTQRTLAQAWATWARMALLVLPASALLACTAASAAEPPPLKEGLWSIHNQGIMHPGDKKIDFTSTLCRTHAFDAKTLESAKNMKDCSTVKDELVGDTYFIESRCTIEGSTVDSKSTTIFHGDTTHTEAHITYTPPLRGISDSTMTQDQKYLGNCPAGAKGGDLMTPNGTMHHLGQSGGGEQH
jgi:hypothetical protein